jgi:hypothetical protein
MTGIPWKYYVARYLSKICKSQESLHAIIVGAL